MSLLAPLFLIATPLLALPVLLHFYRGRSPEAVEWGAMHFLVDAVNEGRRWEKLEELLLMLLRVLALAALVFALARPMAPGSWLGGGVKRDVVLVLDDSMSTAALDSDADGQAVVLDEIKRSAHKLIDDLSGEDRVQVLAASAGGRWLTTDSVAATPEGRRRLHELVDELKPTQGAADLVTCLRAAERLGTSEESTAQRIWLFTDGQAGSLRPDAEAVWRGFSEQRAERSLPVTTQVVLCGADDAPADNLAIGSVEAESYTLRQNSRASVKSVILNRGAEQSLATEVKWLLNGEEVATSSVGAIDPGAESLVRAEFVIRDPGVHVVECRLEMEDTLALDQSAKLVLSVAKQSPVLIVESTDTAAPGDLTNSQLLMAALGYEPGQEDNEEDKKPWQADFQPETIDPSRLSEVDLSRFVAVIVADAGPMVREDVDRLAAYVATGGGVWLTLSESIDIDRFNAVWHDDGEGLCPVAVSGLAVDADALSVTANTTTEGEAVGVTIHPPKDDHPATQHLANTTGLDIDKARLEQHWQLAKETPLGEPAAVLLASGSGDPLVVERYLGQGRVIVQATPLGFGWSNLPRLKAYVVMVNDWLQYLSIPSRDRHNLSPGAPIVVQAPDDDRVVQAVVTTPVGDEVELTARGETTNAVFRYTQTGMPGMYRVAFNAGGETLEESPFAAARPAEESNLTRLTDEEAAQITDWSGVLFDAEVNAHVVAEGAAPSRQPVWWALLVGLLTLLVAELLLANHVGRLRVPPANAG